MKKKKLGICKIVITQFDNKTVRIDTSKDIDLPDDCQATVLLEGIKEYVKRIVAIAERRRATEALNPKE